MDKSKKTKNRQIAELEHRLLDAVTADEVHQDDIVEEKETTAEKMIIKKYPMNHISK